MAIPLFSGDATRTDSYVDATVQISGSHITEEIYCGGRRTLVYPDQFAVVIKQSREASTRDVCDGQSLRVEILKLFCAEAAISLENVRLDPAQLQLLQSKKMSRGNLVVGVAHEINNSVGLIAANLQLALDEVFDVHS